VFDYTFLYITPTPTICITYNEHVSVALVIQRALCTVACPTLHHFSTSHKWLFFLGGGGGADIIEHKMCVSILSATFI